VETTITGVQTGHEGNERRQKNTGVTRVPTEREETDEKQHVQMQVLQSLLQPISRHTTPKLLRAQSKRHEQQRQGHR
jgi:hypothetical protein